MSKEPARISPEPATGRRYASLARRDTKPEVELRRILHCRGQRYRVTYRVPGLPRRSVDVAFTRARLAVFVDGCFWHGCPEHGTSPHTNSEWWTWKIQRNKDRDTDTNERLGELGWAVVRVWEHEDPEVAADRVLRTVEAQKSRS